MISKRVASLLSFLLLAGLGAALALPSCDPYSPSYEDLKCGPEGECPGDLACVQGVCRAAVAQECGDGMAVGTEICDDGNTADGDGCNATCTAANCYIPVTYATLAEGLADPACATLFVQSGTYAGRFEIARDVTVLGVGATPPILDGEQLGSVVSVGSGVLATLRNLTIKNGKALSGGGIINRGSVDLERVTVTENIAEDTSPNGGGIENLAGSLTLNASMVSKNRLVPTAATGANLSGIGIHSTGGTITLKGESYVEENDLAITGISGTTGRGGGIGAINTMITITEHSAVRRNDFSIDGHPGYGSVLGAGIYMSAGTLTMNGDSVIDNNVAAAAGVTSSGNTGASSAGGGLYAINASINLTAALFHENKATARGEQGTSALGGAVALRGGTIVSNGSVFTDNVASAVGLGASSLSATAGGGGLDFESTNGTFVTSLLGGNTVTSNTESVSSSGNSSGGGLRLNVVGGTRNITLTRCTVENNIVTSQDSTALGGGIFATVNPGGTDQLAVTLLSSTISGNKLQAPVSALGAGLRAVAPDTTTVVTFNLANSTISGNKADGLTGTAGGGALYASTGAGSAKVNLNLASSTLAGNSAVANTITGGGIALQSAATPAAIVTTMKNTILADNTGVGTNPDCVATTGTTITSGGYNLLGVATGCTYSATTGHLTGASGLGPLADNGKPTKTHSLNAGSQAINAGNPAGCTDLAVTPVALTTDQRGLVRAVGRCDIGAYEVQ